MGYLAIWILCGLIAVAIGRSKGQSDFATFLVGLLLGPIGILLVLLSKTDTAAVERRQIATGQLKKCPFCGEMIKTEAVVCRFCGRDLPAETPPDPSVARVISNGKGGYVCSSCGGGIRSDATTCKHCGKALFIPAATYVAQRPPSEPPSA